MAWTWHAVDLKTGKRGPQLQMQSRGKVGRILCESTDAQAAVLCWDAEKNQAVPEWRYWTEPGRMLALLVDDDDRPIWGGVILRRIPDETVWVPLAMATLEHYLDRRYLNTTLAYASTEQTTIASGIANRAVVLDGVPFTIDAKPTGVLRDRTYYDSEDKTPLSLLNDLVNIQNGIEFTVDLEWQDSSNTVLKYMLRIGSRIGKALAVPTRFEHPGSVQKFTIPQDYSRENGANDSMAVSSGEGDVRPMSSHYVDTASLGAGWVRYEHRFTPSTSITDVGTLNAYAAEDVALKRAGLTELTMVANLDTCPKINADWWLGDDITAALTAPSLPPWRDPDGVWWPGYEKRVRVVGYDIDLDARELTPKVREY